VAVRLSDSKGYLLDVSVDDKPTIILKRGQVAVDVLLSSPRSAYFLGPLAVDRLEVMALVVHLDAMMDGLVDAFDPDSDEGWVHFTRMLLSIRRVFSPDGQVGFEVALNDCGCDDEREFNHCGFIAILTDRASLERELVALDASARTSRSRRS
jgi:hypothetical protein